MDIHKVCCGSAGNLELRAIYASVLKDMWCTPSAQSSYCLVSCAQGHELARSTQLCGSCQLIASLHDPKLPSLQAQKLPR